MAKKKLTTKDVKVGGGNLPKTLQPGNTVIKINGIKSEEFDVIPGDALIIVLSVEGQPLPGFEGFLVDKDDPEGPRHDGQVGNVKASEWAYVDGTTKSGIEISRDNEILKFIKSLCIALDCVDWFDKADGKYDTIEDLIEGFNKSGVYKDIWLEACLGGKEYLNRNNYTQYDLFFPKYSKDGAPFGPADAEKSKVVQYDPEKHLRKKKEQPVEEFGSTDAEPLDTEGAGDEFDL